MPVEKINHERRVLCPQQLQRWRRAKICEKQVKAHGGCPIALVSTEIGYHNPNIPILCRLRSRFGGARARRNDFGVGVPVSSSQQRTSQRRQHGPQPTPRCSIDLRFARCPTGTDLSSLRVQAARRRPRGAHDWPSRGRGGILNSPHRAERRGPRDALAARSKRRSA